MTENTQKPCFSSRSPRGSFQVLSLNEQGSSPREYKRRRMHRKTKAGCLTCKAKRVKCDEARPVCLRCERNGHACSYIQEADKPSKLGVISKSVQPVSKLSSVTVIPFHCPAIHNGTPSLHLMQHFDRHWSSIFRMPRNEDITGLFQVDSLVRNTILALAACHLRHVSPAILEHRLAEHFQQSLALRDYQRYLDTPRDDLGQPGVNSLLFSAALLNMLAFALPPSEYQGANEDPSTSWVFDPNEDGLGWLAMQAGIRPLMISMAGYLSNATAFLGLMLVGDDQWTTSISVSPDTEETIPLAWLKTFKLDVEDCEPITYVYRMPLLVLAHLQLVEPSRVSIFRNLQFLGKMYADFRGLLYERDERALWLFGYWLGLMSRYKGMWWCEQRVRRDYEAIRIWLNSLNLVQRPGSEGELWRQMMKDYYLAPIWPRVDTDYEEMVRLML